MGMGQKINIPENEFRRLYLEENWAIKKCADYFGCSVAPIHKKIKELGIGKNPWKEGTRESFSKKIKPKELIYKFTKEDFYDYYIVQNHTIEECAKHFGCSRDLIFIRKKQYQISKNAKEIQIKRVETNRKKFGCDNPMQSRHIKEKFKDSFLKKYGVDNPLKDKDVREKRGKTMLSKYGVEFPLQNEGLKKKARKTNLIKYGRNNPAQRHIPKESIEIVMDREKMKKFILGQEDKTTFALAEKLGYTHLHMNDLVHELELDEYIDWGGSVSHYEKELKKWLKSLGYDFYHTRAVIKPYELDLYNKDKKVAIEFNGDYWHSKLPKKYHLNKSLACDRKGIRLIHVWEHEWNNPRQNRILRNIILSALKDNSLKPIYARKCQVEVRPSRSMRKFFNENNIADFRGAKFAICLVYEGEVVMAYNMGNAYWSKGRYDWEVVRGATKLGYYVIGGASKLWKYFVKEYNPKNCVYYIDFNQFNGNSVEKLGFKFLRTELSVKNYWPKEQKVTNRDPSRHKEIKELEKQGLVIPLWNAGVKTYVWGEPNF